MATQLSKLERETKGLKAFPLLILLGWGLIGFAILIFVLVLGPTGAAYWGDNAKAARDAASGGNLLDNLSILASTPKYLAPLIFTGVASFMVGIAMEFASIPGLISRRTAVLKKAILLMGSKN